MNFSSASSSSYKCLFSHSYSAQPHTISSIYYQEFLDILFFLSQYSDNIVGYNIVRITTQNLPQLNSSTIYVIILLCEIMLSIPYILDELYFISCYQAKQKVE